MKPTELPKEDRWRFDLLSSSLPLEFRIAKELTRRGFIVTPDYQCERTIDEDNDWSVDISATGYPDETQQRLNESLELLVECKYRRPGTVSLFFLDPNERRYAALSSSSAITVIDHFSDVALNRNVFRDFSRSFARCYKGVEIWPHKEKSVDDSELRHGLRQLQSAIPRLIADHLESELSAIKYTHDENELIALLYAPILVTTAELRVANEEFEEAVLLERGLDAVSSSVQYLMTYFDTSGGFGKHWKRHFGPLERFVDTTEMAALRSVRHDAFKTMDVATRSGSPLRRLQSLVSGESSVQRQHASAFIVCTADGFARLVDTMIEVVRRARADGMVLSAEQIQILENASQ